MFIDKPLSLLAAGDNPADTVIDGQGLYRGIAIRYPHSTTNLFVIDGFTISNGFALNTGGGMAMNSGNYGLDVTLRNCVFQDNRVAWGDADSAFAAAGSRGGAIGIYETQPGYVMTVSNCVFRNNEALHGGAGSGNAGQGGAIYLRGGYEPLRLVDCLFESNKATAAGALLYSFANLQAERCIFRHNTAALLDSGVLWYSTGAGGIELSYGTAHLRNCLAHDNTGEGRAGFMYGSKTRITLDNCTVVSNRRPGAVGGVYARYDEGELCLRNSIVYNNPDGNWSVSGELGDSFMTNSCTVPASGLPGSGNTELAPAFANIAVSNYRLSRTSPCVNAGTNQPWMVDGLDLDGYPRIDAESGRVDIGCFEYYGGGTLFLYY